MTAALGSRHTGSTRASGIEVGCVGQRATRTPVEVVKPDAMVVYVTPRIKDTEGEREALLAVPVGGFGTRGQYQICTQ